MNPQGVAYLSALRTVLLAPDHVLTTVGDHPNQQGSYEKLHYTFVIPKPTREPLRTGDPARDAIIAKYTLQERQLFDAGDISNMSSISKFWKNINNPDGTINANYGHMVYHIRDAGNMAYNPSQGLVSQWQWAKQCLQQRQDTAQAVLHFNRPKDQWVGNRDQPCCMYSQFLIRNDHLSLSVNMRSNDLWFGTPYNIAYHVELLYRMHTELIPTYPTLQVGELRLYAASLHIYERHRAKATALLMQ